MTSVDNEFDDTLACPGGFGMTKHPHANFFYFSDKILNS